MIIFFINNLLTPPALKTSPHAPLLKERGSFLNMKYLQDPPSFSSKEKELEDEVDYFLTFLAAFLIP
jgi:hypothetical protein